MSTYKIGQGVWVAPQTHVWVGDATAWKEDEAIFYRIFIKYAENNKDRVVCVQDGDEYKYLNKEPYRMTVWIKHAATVEEFKKKYGMDNKPKKKGTLKEKVLLESTIRKLEQDKEALKSFIDGYRGDIERYEKEQESFKTLIGKYGNFLNDIKIAIHTLENSVYDYNKKV